MKKKIWRSLFFSIALITSTCGSLATLSRNNNTQNLNDGSSSFDVPTLDDNTQVNEEKNKTSAINNLFSAKQIEMNSLIFNIYPDYTDKSKILNIKLNDLDIDLTNANTLSFNFYSNVNISYSGFETTLDIEYKEDDYLYINQSKGNAFKCLIPTTLNDVFSLLKTLGININSNNSVGNVSLKNILNYAKEFKTENNVSTTETNGYIYSISHIDSYIDNRQIKNLDIKLYADNNNIPTSINTTSDIIISDTNNTSSIGFNFEGSFKEVKSISTYSSHQNSNIDISDNIDSIFTTIMDLFKGNYSSNISDNGEKLSQANFKISSNIIKKGDNDTTYSSKIDGTLQADLTDVFEDENYGKYSLSLSQTSADNNKSLNDLFMYYNSNNLYVSLNEIFKSKVTDTKLKNVFSKITEISNNLSFKEVDENLNLIFNVVKQSDLSKLLNGDYSLISTLIKSFLFSENSLSVTFNKDLFSLTEDITLSLNFSEENKVKKLKNITIDKISLSSLTLENLTLSIEDYTDIITPNDEEYSSLDNSLNLFDSLSQIIDSKTVSADYSLIYTDEQNVTFNASGNIYADVSKATIDTTDNNKVLHTNEGNYYLSFNLPKEKNSDDILGQGIEMYYSSTDKNLYFGFEYDQNDNFTSLKDSKQYVFKNSLAYADIYDMYKLIDSKIDSTSDSTSTSILSMSTILDTISQSEKFKTIKSNLNNYLSLKDLDGVLNITTDSNNNLMLTLDPSEFLLDSKYQNNTSKLTLNVSNQDNSISLAFKGKINSNDIDFTINLNSNSKEFTYFNTTDYPTITNAQAMLESFVSLPTDLKQFDLSISGSMQDESKDIPSLYIEDTSGISVDLTDTDKADISGVLNIKHPSLSDSTKLISSSQKLEFNYQTLDATTTSTSNKEIKDGQFILEYNDNMHVKMQKGDIFSMLSTLKSVDSEDNLLYRYLKFLNQTVESSGSPLMDVINGKALSTSGIFAYPYFKSVNFYDGRIEIDIDPKIIKSDAKDGSDALITINYDSTTKKITSASIKAKYVTDSSTKNIEASLGLSFTSNRSYQRNTTDSSQSNYILPYSETDKSKFVDINGFKVLLDCVIDTTENNFMEMQGNLKISIPIISDVTASAYAAIYVQDETAYVYLKINAFQKSISDEDYRCTEFFIKEKEVYVNQTKTSKSLTSSTLGLFNKKYQYTTSSESYKTNSENITNNIAYYILDYCMNLSSITLGSTVLEQIYSANSSSDSSSVTINDDFSKVIDTENTNYDSSSNTFNFSLLLDNLLTISSLVKIPTLKIAISHDSTTKDGETYTPLKKVSIVKAEISLASLFTISITADDSNNVFTLTSLDNITATQAKEEKMNRYYSFVEQFNSDHPSPTLYQITSISKASSPTYTGDVYSFSISGEKNVTSYDIDYSKYIYLCSF